jgi:hypothetical protein
MEKLPSFLELIRKWIPPDELELIENHEQSLAEALRAGDDQLHILSYLRGLGLEIRTLVDLAQAIAALPDEEELSVERAAEGVVVRHASDGWLALFTA